MARPTKLSPELEAQIVTLLRAGNYPETAAAAAGISRATFYNWLREGARAKRGVKRQFRDRVLRAIAESEALDLEVIRKASAEHWQAAAWRLERRFPDRYGRRVTATFKVPGDEPTPDDDVKRALDEYADAFGDLVDETAHSDADAASSDGP